jgi:hypothetical protein
VEPTVVKAGTGSRCGPNGGRQGTGVDPMAMEAVRHRGAGVWARGQHW